MKGKPLRDRAQIKGFEVVNTSRTRRIELPEGSGPHGIIIDTGRGYFMGQDGTLYAVDAYECLCEINSEGVGIIAVEIEEGSP